VISHDNCKLEFFFSPQEKHNKKEFIRDRIHECTWI
jgi:hypothetical protein